MKTSRVARQVAEAINKLYADTPALVHDQIDTLRDTIGQALAVDGQCDTSKFNDIARTVALP